MKKIILFVITAHILFFQPSISHAVLTVTETQKNIDIKGFFSNRDHSLNSSKFPIFGSLSVYVSPASYSVKKFNKNFFFTMKSVSRMARLQILPVYGNFLRVSASTK